MKLIRQKNKSDYAIAAVAMAAGKSYAEVKRICGSSRGGLEDHAIAWLLGEFCKVRVSTPTRAYTAKEWAERHPKAIAVLSICPMFGGGHAVAVADGTVYCPAEASPEDWTVIRAFIIS